MTAVEILRRPVTGPSAWRSADHADGAWVRRWTAGELDELEHVVTSVRQRGVVLDQAGADDFAFDGVAAVLDEVLRELEDGRGFVVLRGLPVDRYTDDEIGIVYWGMGTRMGQAHAQNGRGDRLGHVFDQGLDFRETNVRGYTTRAHLPFHTDGSDAVGLLCLRAARRGGLSSLASSMTVHNEILATRPDLLDELYEVWEWDRRGEHPPGEPPTFRSSIFSFYEGKLSCRYVPGILRSAPEKTGVALTASQVAALDLFDEVVGRNDIHLDMALEPGDIQFVNNYTVLHSRTEYEDHDDPARRRHLLRLWLRVSNGRTLDPRQRIGTFRGASG